MKQPKNAIIRARCHEDLKKGVEDIAKIQNIDPADVIRNACHQYIRKVREAVQFTAMNS